MGIDDIIKSLECCGQEDSKGCDKCPLRTEHAGVCIKAKAKAAEVMKQQQQKIEELEERIAIMMECKPLEDEV